MKLSINIELDKDSSQLLKTSFVNFSQQINDLIGIFGKVNCSVKEVAVPEPEPEPESAPKPAKPATKKKTKPRKSNKMTLLKVIKKHKDGISFKELQQETRLTGKQISDNAYRLKQENQIEKTKDGLFVPL
jgi:predicted Rossmann fold nucleotide-binding protein DprA/Smf involved in DNA uptake